MARSISHSLSIRYHAGFIGHDAICCIQSMPRRPALSCLFALLAMAVGSANASTWQTCHLDVRIAPHQARMLAARLLKVRSKPGVTCPAPGETIVFAPESADYQTMLPRKAWPATGSTVRMRYLYLDGTCKNDGDPKPCRIEHYPLDTPAAGGRR